MHRSRPLLPLGLTPAALLCLGAFSPTAALATTIDLSWNACGPIQSVAPYLNPQAELELFISAMGQSEPHSGYQFRFALADPGGTVPDAWRFDGLGCQDSPFITIEERPSPPVAVACPTFASPVTTLVTRTYQFEASHVGVPSGSISGLIAHSYARQSGPYVPTQRYFLGRFRFDHVFSVPGPTTPGVDCGGLDSPICIELMPAHSWWRNDQNEHVPFQIGAGSAGFRESCEPVSVESSTWGAIKSTYRR